MDILPIRFGFGRVQCVEGLMRVILKIFMRYKSGHGKNGVEKKQNVVFLLVSRVSLVSAGISA